ncbi:hypothetical protein DFH09DRAFT_1420956 [Mycena vulgaris]|nr:hypothetical protein DFH09DRAFT_1420956 [Mycena vulgaris]
MHIVFLITRHRDAATRRPSSPSVLPCPRPRQHKLPDPDPEPSRAAEAASAARPRFDGRARPTYRRCRHTHSRPVRRGCMPPLPRHGPSRTHMYGARRTAIFARPTPHLASHIARRTAACAYVAARIPAGALVSTPPSIPRALLRKRMDALVAVASPGTLISRLFPWPIPPARSARCNGSVSFLFGTHRAYLHPCSSAGGISAPPASRLSSLHARELLPRGWSMAGNPRGVSAIRIRIRARYDSEGNAFEARMIPPPTHLRAPRADTATAGAQARRFIMGSCRMFALR